MNYLIIIILYFVLLILGVFFRGPKIGTRYSNFYKCFFPNWRFFEDVLPIPLLFYRFREGNSKTSDWILITKPRARNFFNFPINSEGNLNLYKASLIEAFVIEAQEKEPSDIENLTEFKMIQALCLAGAKKLTNETFFEFQFKIETHSYKDKSEEIVTSEWMKNEL